MSNKSLRELEAIYGKNKNLQNEPDMNFEKLRITTDEVEHTLHTKQQINQKKQSEYFEIKSFLPTSKDKLINTRYESPLRTMKLSARNWRFLTILFAAFSLGYLSFHFWIMMTLNPSFSEIPVPGFIIEASYFAVQMKDVLFDSYTLSTILDCWALIIFILLFCFLLKDSLAKIDPSQEIKPHSSFAKVTLWSMVLFTIVSMVGTLEVFHDVYQVATKQDLVVLFIFHSSKLFYFVLNIITFKKYKKTKIAYEDLLCEALGTSDDEDESNEEEVEHHEENTFTSDA